MKTTERPTNILDNLQAALGEAGESLADVTVLGVHPKFLGITMTAMFTLMADDVPVLAATERYLYLMAGMQGGQFIARVAQ